VSAPTSELLTACPAVTILGTSRVGPGVPDEITWRVPSLGFPWPDHRLALAGLENFEAVAGGAIA
jgi:predicted ATPase